MTDLHILRNPWGHSEDAVQQARLDAADEIESLRSAVRMAGQVFAKYAEIHRAKGTPEGDEKASNNEALAVFMQILLKEVAQ
jgi:hypothetical protein